MNKPPALLGVSKPRIDSSEGTFLFLMERYLDRSKLLDFAVLAKTQKQKYFANYYIIPSNTKICSNITKISTYCALIFIRRYDNIHSLSSMNV